MNTPEKECQTCDGSGVLGASSAGGWQRCPDCTPENVKCRACEGDGTKWCDCAICQATVGDRCGHCNGTGRTPENVEEPT